MFAVATPNLGAIAETYIRQHIREIAPGKTSVVCFKDEGKSLQSVPVIRLRKRRKDLPWLKKRITGLRSFMFWGYSGVIDTQEQDRLINFFGKHSVKTVLAEFGPMGCSIMPACKKAQIDLFVYFHGYDATTLARKWMYRHAYRKLGKEVKGIFCASQYLAEKLIDFGMQQNKIHIVAYGIDVNKFKPAQSHDPDLVLAVGRFVEKKAPHLTLEAFARVLNRFPEKRLEMIGDGPLLSRCISEAKKLKIKNNVIFHGAKENDFVNSKLRKASVFMQHSVTAPNGDTESLGVSLLEAMALEVPVVVTRHNGFVTTVQENRTGFLVDEYDVKGMAEKVSEILGNVKLRDEMGKSGRIWVSKYFSSDTQISELRKIMRIKE